MTAIQESRLSTTGHIRPFDIRRDLNPVADLVEMCFADTLDVEGQRYLRQMREAARSPSFMRWASIPENGTSMAGFVWIEDGRLVGNLSLIPFTLRRQKCFLIANVAVHPNYRRKGIARALTEEARRNSIRKNAYATWLHVREENQPARELYESEGFTERARRTTWHALPGASPSLEPPPGVVIGSRRSYIWQRQEEWLQRAYPSELTWHLPLQLGSLKPGILESIAPWLSLSSLRHWAAYRGEEPLAAVTYQPMAGFADMLWVSAPENFDPWSVSALLAHVRRKLPSNRPLAIDFPAHTGDESFLKAGFSLHQTLIWMETRP